ncbi:MAG: hypothetical protein E6Q97_03230 [Desulfurellales bacterium]|nr:MAG: hypothetical protein E6Q97_03230 [Desulfurellales bacterium]
MSENRPVWVGALIDVVAIVAAVVLVLVHAISGEAALGWIGFVQSGRLYVWATRARAKPSLPSESGLLILILAAGSIARDVFARHHHV